MCLKYKVELPIGGDLAFLFEIGGRKNEKKLL